MALTSAMEHSRLAVHHVGKLLFSQCTELVNPTMNRGLPPNMAATDPSLNYACKGIDIACAAYLGELGFLAGNVSSHVQSAEMHNQAVNSLALVSARYTIHAVEVLSLLTANYLYVLCQALDLRALQHEFSAYLTSVVTSELTSAFTSSLSASELRSLITTVVLAMRATLDSTTTMDVEERMEKVAASASAPLLQFFTSPSFTSTSSDLNILHAVRNMQKNTSTQLSAKHRELQRAYLLGERGSTPASHLLGKGTKPVYELIRRELGVRMHGRENLEKFEMEGGIGGEGSVGGNVTLIYEAIRDGRFDGMVKDIFA
jgi:phenylalanine ammonia-lyase